MNISASVLSRFISLQQSGQELRMLLDDVGIEVKRFSTEQQAGDLFTLELLANRGDHHCYLGVARELSGRTGATICSPQIADLTVGECPIEVRLSSPLCGIYTATLMERTGDESPLNEAQLAPLQAAEIHSLTAAVDASNLANLELGQPTHAFDADTIVGGIAIRASLAGEQAWPLFADDKVELPEGTLVIADDEKILAIAGVIGCEESKTTATTTRLLLESAHFDPVAVRKASRALGIATDSSARFERGSDPSAVLLGAGRVIQLLESTGSWKRVGATRQVGSWTDPARAIPLSITAASTFLGMALGSTEVVERLERYGFTVHGTGESLSIIVPPHRLWDVEYPADLYEELAKSIGYNHTPEGLPPVEMGALPTHADQVKLQVEEVLLGDGFYEVFTSGFHGTQTTDRLGLPENHPLSEHIQTTNALDRGYGLVKNNCLAQAVEAIASNRRVGIEPIKMYEWTRTFHPDPSADNSICTERGVLWAAASGSQSASDWSGAAPEADAWFFKGLVQEIGTALQLPLVVGPADPSQPLSDCLHPGRQAAITLDGSTVGLLGEIHPRICAAHKLKRSRPVYLEIGRAALHQLATVPRYAERSAHQPIQRSLAFTLPLRIKAGQVQAILGAQASVQVMDLFRHVEEGEPVRTVTFQLVFDNPTGSTTAEQVNQRCEGLIAQVTGVLGERGVRLRG
jgi:phenylalanyl-tRNA synthetase beta chain